MDPFALKTLEQLRQLLSLWQTLEPQSTAKHERIRAAIRKRTELEGRGGILPADGSC